MPVSKLVSVPAQKKAELDEMRRNYEVRGMTLKEIGKLLGVTRQAVHSRFVAAGIPRRSHYSKKFIEYTEQRRERANRLLMKHRDDILRMYVDERLALVKIAKGSAFRENEFANTLLRAAFKYEVRAH